MRRTVDANRRGCLHSGRGGLLATRRPRMRETELEAGGRDLWVFGYGSLMWHPGFEHADAVHARLTGWHRCFCIWSVVYRGTPGRPGLVLGLDRGGVCEGIALRVPSARASDVLTYLRRREQVTGVYREALVPVSLATEDRTEVMAVAYLAEPAHPGYAGDLPLGVQAELIRGGHGRSGPNIDYCVSTIDHLRALGIREPRLERLRAVLGPLLARIPSRSRGARSGNAPTSPLPAFAAKRFVRLTPGERRRFVHRRVLGAADATNGRRRSG